MHLCRHRERRISTRHVTVTVTTVHRPWRRVNVDDFRDSILASPHGPPELLPIDVGVDNLAALYDRELLAIADRWAPARTMTVLRRQSDAWLDQDCRTAKRSVLRAECRARRSRSALGVAACTAKLRAYRDPLRAKRETFWQNAATAAHDHPHDLWSTFDRLLGRGRTPVSVSISASTFHEFFDTKFDMVREATACPNPPSFQPVASDRHLSTLGSVTAADVTDAIIRLPDRVPVICSQHEC
jgi:hypothetical protein